ncbi:MAG: BMP family ABC transporter substrate-binding protein, partial [Lachnospiraceae bacterium]|nr:BMP family ABC transporter substrate-binding protein [Lachnospiraceae bacterium]
MVLVLTGAVLCGCGNKIDPDEKRYAFVGTEETEKSVTGAQSIAGLEAAADARPCVMTKYGPETDAKTDPWKGTMKTAVKDGAKIVICIGEEMKDAVVAAQDAHKKTKFVLIEGDDGKEEAEEETQESTSSAASTEKKKSTSSEEGTVTPEDAKEESTESKKETEDAAAVFHENACTVTLSQREIGFLVGYVLVADGYNELGFMGGEETEAETERALGFLAGCDRAAQDLAMPTGSVHIRYCMTGDDLLNPQKMERAMQWYDKGTQVIYAPADGVRRSVVKGAETTSFGYVAASGEKDVLEESSRILVCALTDYSAAVRNVVSSFENDAFPGGEALTYGITDGCISLSADYMRFRSFNTTA